MKPRLGFDDLESAPKVFRYLTWPKRHVLVQVVLLEQYKLFTDQILMIV